MPVGTHTSALAGAAGALGTAKKRALPAATSTFSSTSSGGYSWGERGNTVGTPAEPGAVGLHNLGNTCFMNSMLQCLSATGALTAYFKSGGWSVDLNEDNALGADGKMARAYAELVRNLWDGRYTQVAPAALKRVIGEHAPAFAGYQQQDSQELMIFLLDGLHEDLNRVRRKPYVEAVESDGRPDAVVAEDSWRRYLLRNDSVLVDRCHGLLRSHVTCPACNYESITFDAYTCLSLPLPGAREAEDGSGKRAIPLADCFEKFLEREQLGADNQWYCSSCKEHKQASINANAIEAYKKFDIWTTPDVLILHLKRFQYLPGQYLIHRQKIDDLVQFPVENLDLSDVLRRCGAPVHADAPPVYDLFAVSEHSGTLRGGHYTATARNPLSGKWYGFNDGHVFETATQQAVSPQAYVLFYARRKGALRWGGMPGGT
ncbi:hypothetical protein JKP88DRAFT_270259 [Tribonema minus]|uniref:Ubiquitin carboxyl-terminal hydrolase n=1 Tax=Tribonema minus TaxID=303371 RepID=A0A836CC49_9STRA|nr:hypothetical protein JKP88DRAFT_270259 [Tribonema minus]